MMKNEMFNKRINLNDLLLLNPTLIEENLLKENHLNLKERSKFHLNQSLYHFGEVI